MSEERDGLGLKGFVITSLSFLANPPLHNTNEVEKKMEVGIVSGCDTKTIEHIVCPRCSHGFQESEAQKYTFKEV